MRKISLICLIVFFLDRISKMLVSSFLKLNFRNKIIDNFFYITNCHNKGAAFSIFSGSVLFLILITIMVVYIIYKNLKNKKEITNLSSISYGLLLGGIFGNLFDRLFYGYVIDFIDFVIFKYNFPIFNIADIAICVGAFMFLFFEGSGQDGNKINSD